MSVPPVRELRRGAATEAALALAVLGFAATMVVRGVRVTEEDGFYYLKIAQLMAAGRGSTFDGLHATNGYQPLWLLCLVPVFRLLEGSPEAAMAAATLLQAGLLCVAAVLAVRLARASGLEKWPAALVGCVWIALTLRTGLSGVEFALTAAIVTGVAFHLRRNAPPAPPSLRAHALMGLLLGLAVLSRLDTALLAALVGLEWGARARSGPGAAARIGALCAPVALLGGAYVLANVVLFGHPWPVSGVAKRIWSRHLLAADPIYQGYGWLAAKAVHLARPLASPLGAAMTSLLVGGAGACALLLTGPVRPAGAVEPLRAVLRPLRPLVLFAGLQPLAYGLLYHGHYTYAPWYYVAQPFLTALMAGAALQAVLRRAPARVAAVAPAAAGAIVLAASFATAARGWSPAAERPLYRAARWARDHLDASARVGAWNAGAIAFLSGRQVVNLDGVVNTFDYLERGQYDLCAYWERTGITHLVDVFEAREGSAAMKGATLPVSAYYARCADRLELLWSERVPGDPGWPKAFRIVTATRDPRPAP